MRPLRARLLLALACAALACPLPASAARGFGTTEGSATTDRIAVPSYAAVQSLGTLTVSAWVYRIGAGGGSGGRLLDSLDVGAAGNYWTWVNSSTNYGFIAARWLTTNGLWVAGPSTTGAWLHLIFTYDYGSTANDPVIYLVGTSQTVTELSAPAGTPPGADTATVVIGNRTSADRNWDGRLAEVAIWNRILTADEKTALGNGAAPGDIAGGRVLYLDLLGSSTTNWDQTSVAPTVTGTAQKAHPTTVYHRRRTFSGRGAAR